MVGFFSTKEIAEIWGITSFRVSALRSSGKILGAVKHGKVWKIPCDAERPEDRRIKQKSLEDCKFTFIEFFIIHTREFYGTWHDLQ